MLINYWEKTLNKTTSIQNITDYRQFYNTTIHFTFQATVSAFNDIFNQTAIQSITHRVGISFECYFGIYFMLHNLYKKQHGVKVIRLLFTDKKSALKGCLSISLNTENNRGISNTTGDAEPSG